MTVITVESWHFSPTEKTATTTLQGASLKDVIWRVVRTQKTVASHEATWGLYLSFKYYPVLTVLLHLITWASVLLIILTLFNIRVVSVYFLTWMAIGFGGLTVVLAKASREINEHRRS